MDYSGQDWISSSLSNQVYGQRNEITNTARQCKIVEKVNNWLYNSGMGLKDKPVATAAVFVSVQHD